MSTGRLFKPEPLSIDHTEKLHLEALAQIKDTRERRMRIQAFWQRAMSQVPKARQGDIRKMRGAG